MTLVKNSKVFIFFALMFTVLVVVYVSYSTGQKVAWKKCDMLSDQSEKQKCLSKTIKQVVSAGGVPQGLKMVYDLSVSDSFFSNNCHDYIHIVGNSAYERFIKTGNVEINEHTSICAYGFYHGFMEALVSTSGDINVAKSFCQKIRDKYMAEMPMANLACFHGIGHGWAGTHDKSLWGDELAMVNPALEMCEKVTSDPHELKICATGVFDSISIGYYNQLYGLEIKKNDPFWLCKKQASRYKEPCYMDLTPAVAWLGEYKMKSSFEYLEKVEVEYRKLVVRTISDNIVRFVLNRGEDVFDSILTCRTLAKEYVDSCVSGTANGALQFGKPGIEYQQGLALCEDARMHENEKSVCLTEVMRYSYSNYPKEKFNEICSAKDGYKIYCKNLDE